MPHFSEKPFLNILKPFKLRSGMGFYCEITVIKSMGRKYDQNEVQIMELKNGNEWQKKWTTWIIRLGGVNFGSFLCGYFCRRCCCTFGFYLLPGTVSRTVELNKCIETLVSQTMNRCNDKLILNGCHTVLVSFDPTFSLNTVEVVSYVFFLFMLLLLHVNVFFRKRKPPNDLYFL